MPILDLDALKQREERLGIPLVDMALVTTLFVSLGILAALSVILATAWKLGWGSVVLLFWNIGLFTAAAAIGFLFGHPRVARPATQERLVAATVGNIAGPVPPEPTVKVSPDPMIGNAQKFSRRLIDPSTALQDIVDWLTKIIVGVGLVELKQLPNLVHRLAMKISQSVSAISPGAASPDSCVGLAVSIVVAASGSGFVFGYLMTRLYLQGAISRADEGLSREAESLKERLEISRTLTLSDEIPTDVFSVDHAYWDQDPNKGKFGGLTEQDGWKIAAELSPTLGQDKPVCDVRLMLQWTKPNQPPPEAARATFYLHPSFNVTAWPVPLISGSATLKIVAWGAFTVGIEILNGESKTRLELDLAQVPGGTVRFYQE